MLQDLDSQTFRKSYKVRFCSHAFFSGIVYDNLNFLFIISEECMVYSHFFFLRANKTQYDQISDQT